MRRSEAEPRAWLAFWGVMLLGLGFRFRAWVQGLGHKVPSSQAQAMAYHAMLQGLGFRVQGLGFRAQELVGIETAGGSRTSGPAACVLAEAAKLESACLRSETRCSPGLFWGTRNLGSLSREGKGWLWDRMSWNYP